MNDSTLNTIYDPKPHLLAFTDAMGFSKKVECDEEVKKYFKMIDHARNHWKKQNEKHEKYMKMTTIGDAVVLAIEVPGPDEEEFQRIFLNRLSYLCKIVSMLQGGLAMKDFWIRGAITHGKLHFTENRIVGAAFHRAYFLEQKVARVPRIIVDGSVVQASGLETTRQLIGHMEMSNLLYDLGGSRPAEFELPRDIPTFIDYAANSGSVHNSVYWVMEVAKHVSRHLHEDLEHYAKYRWIADYLLNYVLIDPVIKATGGTEIDEVKKLLRGS